MVSGIESVRDLENVLRGSGVTITPVENRGVAEENLSTAAGQFTVSRPQLIGRQEQMVTLYNRLTNEEVPTELNNLPARLKKRLPNVGSIRDQAPGMVGQFAFTLGKWDEALGRYVAPGPVQRGELVCMLNPQSPDFAYTRSLGIRSTCIRHNIPNLIDLEAHIQGHHVGVWPLIERDRKERKEQQDRDRLAQLIETVLLSKGIAAPEEDSVRTETEQERPAPLYVSPKTRVAAKAKARRR